MIKAPRRRGLALSTLCCSLFLTITIISCVRPLTLADNGPIAFTALAKGDNAQFNKGYLVMAGPGGRDYVAISSDFSRSDDVLIGIDLSDLMKSGLDPQLLNKDEFMPDYPVYDVPTSTLVLSCNMGSIKFSYDTYKDGEGKPLTAPTPAALFSEMLRVDPSRISLDAQTEIYRISFGPNAGMRWSMTPTGKASALTISLNAAPFIKAGLDPSRLQKWKPVPATQAKLIELNFSLP